LVEILKTVFPRIGESLPNGKKIFMERNKRIYAEQFTDSGISQIIETRK
jgi:hypothetical protein